MSSSKVVLDQSIFNAQRRCAFSLFHWFACLGFLRILLSLSHSFPPSHGGLSSSATARRTCPSTASWQAGDSRATGTPPSPSLSPTAASAAGTDCPTRPPSPVCQRASSCANHAIRSVSTNPLSLNTCSLRRKFLHMSPIGFGTCATFSVALFTSSAPPLPLELFLTFFFTIFVSSTFSHALCDLLPN